MIHEDTGDSDEGEDPQLGKNENGHPTWRMELRDPSASKGLALPQAQIMDTG